VAWADASVGDQLVDRAHEGGLERGPARGVGAVGDAGDVVVVEADVAADDDVLGPLVGGIAHGGDAQHEDLALAQRERRGELHVAVEPVVRLRQRRVDRKRAQHVQALRAVGAPLGQGVARLGRHEGGQRVAHLGGPLGRGQRADAGAVGRSAGHRIGTLPRAESRFHDAGAVSRALSAPTR
jgi:hypothetical protein